MHHCTPVGELVYSIIFHIRYSFSSLLYIKACGISYNNFTIVPSVFSFFLSIFYGFMFALLKLWYYFTISYRRQYRWDAAQEDNRLIQQPVLWDRSVCWNHVSSTSCSAHSSSTQKQGKRPQRIRPTFAAVQSAQLMNERQTDIHEKTSSTVRERKRARTCDGRDCTQGSSLQNNQYAFKKNIYV